MEKIFRFKEDWRPAAVGQTFPQVIDSDIKELIAENMKRNEADKFRHIPDSGYSVKIGKSTKLTDTLSSFMLPRSSIFSEQFINLLKKFRLPPFNLIPVKVFRAKTFVTEKKYFIMHFTGDNITDINFKKSTFDYLTGGAFLDKSLLNFDDYEDYLSKLKNDHRLGGIKIQKTVMKSTLQIDVFYLGLFHGSSLFITQPLKEAIDREQMSGFQITEAGYIED